MGELSITVIDLLVAAVIIISAGFAMVRGLIRETFAIVEWIAAAYLALRFTPVFRTQLEGYVSPPWLEWVLVFLGTFLLVFIPLSIASHRIAEAVRRSEIGPIDRTLGLVFGAARGLVIVGLAYIAFSALVVPADHPEALTKARLFPLIRSTSDVLRSLAPEPEDLAGLGQRVLRAGEEAQPEEPAPVPAAPAYGASDRSALDRLIETNAAGGAPPQ